MRLLDTESIRNTTAARGLVLGRTVASALRAEGWEVREGAAHAGGVVDAAGEKSWRGSRFEVRLRVLVRCHSGGGRVLFSRAEVRKDALPSYTLDAEEHAGVLVPVLTGAGLDALALLADVPAGRRAPRLAPPRARVAANAFREAGSGAADGSADGGNFQSVVNEAFATPAAIAAERLAFDREVLEADLLGLAQTQERAQYASDKLAADARLVEAFHSIVVTDAALWTLGDGNRIARVQAVRLYRPRVTSAECAWIDVVQADALESFVARVTSHYENAHSSRSSTPRMGMRTQSGRLLSS